MPLSGCLLVISTGPTPISQAQIVVIVRTDEAGTPVAGAGVGVHAVGSGTVLGRGVTDAGGRLSLTVDDEVSGLRVVVEAPAGYRVAASGARSAEVVLASWRDQVTVQLARDR